jgi:Leucine-rich repeat (LRR) protein
MGSVITERVKFESMLSRIFRKSEAENEIEFTSTHGELTHIPPAIAQRSRLESLRLANNHIATLDFPATLMPHLRRVDLSHNWIATIEPETVIDGGFLDNVRELELKANRVRWFPMPLLELDLVLLDLSHNAIEVLPKRIDRLENLRMLKLDVNQLCTVPRSIGALRRLELLDLRSNRLIYLPPSIVRLCSRSRPVKLLLARNPRLLSVKPHDDVFHDYSVDLVYRCIPLPDTHIQLIANDALKICIGLQDLGLPALLTLEIVDVALPNNVRMWAKWELITIVKHFRDRNPNPHRRRHRRR